MKYLDIKNYYQCEFSGMPHKFKNYPVYRFNGTSYSNVVICQKCFAAFVFPGIDITRAQNLLDEIPMRQYELKPLSKVLQHQAAMKKIADITRTILSGKWVQESIEFAEEAARISKQERKKHKKQNIWRMAK